MAVGAGSPLADTPTQAAPAAPRRVATASLTKTTDERKAALDAALVRTGAGGWRIETRSDFQATIVKGYRTNRILHLILTILTLGIWAIVRLAAAILCGEKRRMVTVDEDGNIVQSY